MSRPLRIEYEDAFYHVMHRGGGRQAIFHDADYYEAFLSTLEEASKRFGIEIHAYCLMSNHYHLLIKTPKANLSRAMRHINGVYTQRHNRMRKSDGALFRGRYKAILVDSDIYLLHLSKYIHRNRLEAKMVDVLAEYRWSSYPAYIGSVKPPPWLIREMVYAQVTSGLRKAARYQAFMAEDDLDEDLQAFYSKQRLAPILGDEDFVREASRRSAEDLSEVARAERRQFRLR